MLITTLITGTEPKDYEELCKIVIKEKNNDAQAKNNERSVLIYTCHDIVDSISTGDFISI